MWLLMDEKVEKTDEAVVADMSCECAVGEEMVEGTCQPVTVTTNLDIGEALAVVEASTGKSIIRISGIAFHEGVNKNGWALTEEGAKSVVDQMVGSDITLYHPTPEGGRFTRNMDGGVDEAVVGIITEAAFIEGEEWVVRYSGEIHREELFSSLESGLYLRADYGVSIGGTGIPVKVISHDDGRNEMFFGSDFEFDHLAVVHRPAYPKANIEEAVRIEVANEEMFNSDSEATVKQLGMAIDMTDEDNNIMEADIEALKAEMVLRDARIAEFEANAAAQVEEQRVSLVNKATDLGLNGHEDFGIETLEKVIASWEASRPEPTPEPVVEMKPATPAAASEIIASVEEPTSVVANYFNGVHVESDEDLYSRAWNAWAKAYNKVVDTKAQKAPMWADAKEMI